MGKEVTALLVKLVLVDWVAMVPPLSWCDSGTVVVQLEIRAVGCIETMTSPVVCVQLKGVKA